MLWFLSMPKVVSSCAWAVPRNASSWMWYNFQPAGTSSFLMTTLLTPFVQINSTKSQNRRTSWVGRNPQESLSPTPRPAQDHLQESSPYFKKIGLVCFITVILYCFIPSVNTQNGSLLKKKPYGFARFWGHFPYQFFSDALKRCWHSLGETTESGES